MLDPKDLLEVAGATVFDRSGHRLGHVDTVFVDVQTDEPTFAAVRTGLFGTRSSFVPLANAQVRDDGLQVAYEKSQIHDAPSVEADEWLDAAEERELYRYYDIPLADEPVRDAFAQPEGVPGGAPADVMPVAPVGDEGEPGAAAGGRPRGTMAGADLPTGEDLIADQGFDPMFDGPQQTPEERLLLRRLGPSAEPNAGSDAS